VINSLKDTIEENGAQIRFANLPDRVNANPNRLTQLFQNLLANAIKFRKPEVPVVVQINSRDLGNLWEFEVKDNGIGIDPEFHEKVFLLFKKLHSRKDFQGTGLGLAICKKVVEQMGGEIWIESAPNEGSSFFFTMPK
jgi:light-regulated signal transduction histidine kinase (bacteriophytochrome)